MAEEVPAVRTKEEFAWRELRTNAARASGGKEGVI
jgi:hypothetical protein